jgi:hypothetical protein
MGVEYRHLLLPRGGSRRPSAERIVRLIRELETHGYLLPPKSPVLRSMVSSSSYDPRGRYGGARRTGATFVDASDDLFARGRPMPWPVDASWLRQRKEALRISWPLEWIFAHGVPYPLTRTPYLRDGTSVTYELHWSRYLIEVVAENVTAPSPVCGCGAELVVGECGPFVSVSRTRCAACGAKFDPSSAIARIVDCDTRERRSVPGGALYRFALEIDLGKSVPEDGGLVRVRPELRALVERVIGCAFHEIGTFY